MAKRRTKELKTFICCCRLSSANSRIVTWSKPFYFWEKWEVCRGQEWKTSCSILEFGFSEFQFPTFGHPIHFFFLEIVHQWNLHKRVGKFFQKKKNPNHFCQKGAVARVVVGRRRRRGKARKTKNLQPRALFLHVLSSTLKVRIWKGKVEPFVSWKREVPWSRRGTRNLERRTWNSEP